MAEPVGHTLGPRVLSAWEHVQALNAKRRATRERLDLEASAARARRLAALAQPSEVARNKAVPTILNVGGVKVDLISDTVTLTDGTKVNLGTGTATDLTV